MVTKTLSYNHALNSIRLMYRQCGFTVGEHTLGQQVYAEFGSPVAESDLGALYAFVDEQLALLRMVAWYFMSGMVKAASADRAAVFHHLAITHMRTLASIRLLCSSGLDVNARSQLRKLYENAVLWTRLRHDSVALDDFRQARTPETANHFWHKYLAKEKSEQFIAHALGENQFWLGQWSQQIEELKRGIGPTAHPSFLAATFDARQDFTEAGELLVLSTPNQSSHFTLCHAITCASMPFSLKPELPYELECEDFLKIGHPFNCIPHSTESWEEYSASVRDMIPTLMLMAVRFGEKLASGKPGDSIE